MPKPVISFATLFKKYRLRSEIETLSEFGDLLAQEGIVYETSLFTKWQKGERIPRDRKTLIKIVKIFNQKGAIESINEANNIFESAGQGYLTQNELLTLPLLNENILFQAPRRIDDFIGREKQVEELKYLLLLRKIVLMYGQPGIGKTAVAIEMAHILCHQFPDGVLWYQLNITSPREILVSIAKIYGQDIKDIQDISICSSIVRSLTSNKRILFIFDNVENKHNIHELFPSSHTCAVLLTSLSSCREINEINVRMPLRTFTLDETFRLFHKVLGNIYSLQNKEKIEELFLLFEGHPLALLVITKDILYENKTISSFLKLPKKNYLDLSNFSYKNSNLNSILNNSFNQLSLSEQQIFISSSLFNGKDFPIEIIVYINNVSPHFALQSLEKLKDLSLVELSTEGRYRLHPLIKLFLLKKLKRQQYIMGAKYYINMFVKQKGNSHFFTNIENDLDNILPIFNKILLLNEWDLIILLWKFLSPFLWHKGYWNELEWFGNKIYKLSAKNHDNETKILVIQSFTILYFWSKKSLLAEKYAKEGIKLALKINNKFLFNITRQRLGRILLGKNQLKASKNLLLDSLNYFLSKNINEELTNSYMYLGELSLRELTLNDSLDYFLQAIIYANKIAIKDTRMIYKAIIKLYLGEIFLLQNKFYEAKKYFKIGLKYCLQTKEESGNIMRAYIGLGLCYEKENLMNHAYRYLNKSEVRLKSLGIKAHTRHDDTFYYSLKGIIEESTIFNSIISD